MCRPRLIPLLALTLVLGAGPARPSRAQWHADGAPVCTAAFNQGYPTIVSDDAGGTIVTWEDMRGGTSYDIYAQRLDAGGMPQWTADGVALCAAAYDQEYPKIVSDGAGGAVVIWQDYRSGTNWGIYAQRVDAAGASQWSADGVALCTTANAQWGPSIASDGAGGAIVTWEDLRGTYSDIYAQRVDAAGAPQWNPEGVALCAAAYSQQTPRVVEDGAGGAIVTWSDGRSQATSWDIYAQRVNATGVTQWAADGVALCTARNGQFGPAGMFSDGAGGAIVAWTDGRNGNTNGDIYAQHLLASGAGDPAWTPNGVALSAAAESQYSPMMVSDGAGGAIVTWHDYRSGTNWDIYAQRIYGAGAVAAVSPPGAPAHFQLFAPSPNPTRDGRLSIRFSLPASGRVSAQVLDLAGHRVRTLATEREFSPGLQVLGWDGRNDAGAGLPSGVYFVEVRVGTHSEARRAVLLR